MACVSETNDDEGIFLISNRIDYGLPVPNLLYLFSVCFSSKFERQIPTLNCELNKASEFVYLLPTPIKAIYLFMLK